MLTAENSLNLSSLEYVEKVNEKARSYSENEKVVLKRILFNIVEKVILKKEQESQLC